MENVIILVVTVIFTLAIIALVRIVKKVNNILVIWVNKLLPIETRDESKYKEQISTIITMVKVFFVIDIYNNEVLYVWVDDKHLPKNFIVANFGPPRLFKEFIISVKQLFKVEQIQICFPKRSHSFLKEYVEKEWKEYSKWPEDTLPVFTDLPWLKYGWQYYESLEGDLWPKID